MPSKKKKKDEDACKPVMFKRKSQLKRIGPLKKSLSLKHLQDVETLMVEELKKYPDVEFAYDVNAQEIPFYRTLNYTEYAHCMMIHPLNGHLKRSQIRDASDTQTVYDDYDQYFRDKVRGNTANKYTERDEYNKKYPPRDILVVLVGSNKVKERVCLNKLKHIRDTYGDNVYYKPHPITTHAIIGEMKDILGEENLLPRNIDMYYYLQEAEKVYTTHMSESLLYAVVLGKDVEPIEVVQHVHQGSFYHVNKMLFENHLNGENQRNWINYTFSNHKSGIFNPEVDRNWEQKLQDYLAYTYELREKYRTWYIDGKEEYRLKQNI